MYLNEATQLDATQLIQALKETTRLPIVKVCAWCGGVMENSLALRGAYQVSHGCCDFCKITALQEARNTIR